ncbi:MAG: winged helix-turn-helix domain-containing protein [Candidatus Methanofastidiosia archaeon]
MESFKAISNAERRKILEMLDERRRSYKEFLEELRIDRGSLNFHLKKLEDLIKKDSKGYEITNKGRLFLNFIHRIQKELDLKDIFEILKNRLRIYLILSLRREKSFTDLMEILDVEAPKLAFHLKKLEFLVLKTSKGYRLNPKGELLLELLIDFERKLCREEKGLFGLVKLRLSRAKEISKEKIPGEWRRDAGYLFLDIAETYIQFLVGGFVLLFLESMSFRGGRFLIPILSTAVHAIAFIILVPILMFLMVILFLSFIPTYTKNFRISFLLREKTIKEEFEGGGLMLNKKRIFLIILILFLIFIRFNGRLRFWMAFTLIIALSLFAIERWDTIVGGIKLKWWTFFYFTFVIVMGFGANLRKTIKFNFMALILLIFLLSFSFMIYKRWRERGLFYSR